MSTRPLATSAIPGEAPDIQNVLAHQPELRDHFNELYAIVWSRGLIEHRTKEISRLRNARVTGCGFCVNVRFQRDGERISEDDAACIVDGYEDTALSEREIAALRLTDALIGDPRKLDDRQAASIREQLSEDEIVELALCVILGIATEKVLITLGLEPEPGTMPTTVLPTPGSDVPANPA
jgi:alkylhydroperoxidase family enzyme